MFAWRLVLALFCSSTLAFQSPPFPAKAQERLLKNDLWVSYAGLSTPAKKWKVVRRGKTLLGLEEVSEATLSLDCEGLKKAGPQLKLSELGKFMSHGRGKVDVRQPLSLESFLFTPAICGEEKSGFKEFTYASIDELRFVLNFPKMGASIVFYPVPEAAISSPVQTTVSNVFKAPLGSSEVSILGFGYRKIPESAYLHYNLNEEVVVFMDETYPPQFVPDLKFALEEWNSVLPQAIFRLNEVPTRLSVDECYSKRRVCVFWQGSARMPWSGWSGTASQSYDPVTGEIHGGVIRLGSEGAPAVLSTTPVEIATMYKNGGLSLSDLAEWFMKQDKFKNWEHPEPSALVKFILTHELGHINGLSHNFAGSWEGTPDKPSLTVMDYPPFAAISSVVPKIEKYDLLMLDLIYTGRVPKNRIPYCSDLESDDLLSKMFGVVPNPRCRKNDVGDPSDWLILLSQKNPLGVFGVVPLGSAIVPRNILSSLHEFLVNKPSTQEKAKITRFLCSETNVAQIMASLEKDFHYKLICATPMLEG